MKNKLMVYGALILALTACGDGEDRQAKYLERAEKYYAEENYDKAKVDARNVLQINPKNIEAQIILADVSFKEGDIRRAYGTYKNVLSEDETNIDAHIGLTALLTAVKAYAQAIEHADEVLAVQAKNAEVMGFKAFALAGSGETVAARELAEQTLLLEPGNTAAAGVISQIFIDDGDLKSALVVLRKAASANADDPRLSLKIAYVLEQMGDGDALEKELRMLVEKNSEVYAYTNALASFYVRDAKFNDAEAVIREFAQGNPESNSAKKYLVSFLRQHVSQEAAIIQVNNYIESNPDKSEFKLMLADLYLFVGEKEQALSVLDAMVESDPRSTGSIDARNMMLKVYLKDKNEELVSKNVKEVLEIEPENETALLVRSGLSLQAGELKEGIADLRVVLKNNPTNLFAIKGLVGALELNGNVQLALDNYKKLFALETPGVDGLMGAARLAIKADQYQDAEKFIRTALELDRDNPALVTNIVKLLVLKEDWDGAREFADRLIESENSKALGYFLKAGLNIRTSKIDEAITDLKKSLKAQPEAAEPLSALVSLVKDKDGLNGAIKVAKAYCDDLPSQAHCPYILGTLLASNNDYEGAVKELDKSLALAPKFLAAYRQLVKVYAVMGQAKDVERVLIKGIEQTSNKGLSFELATYYYATQNYDEAARVYGDLYTSSKGERKLAAANNLAMLLAENLPSEDNLKKARALIVDLQDSENPAYLDTVGWVLYFANDYDQAVAYLTAAVDKLGSSALLQYHLGMAHYKNGDVDAAKEHLTLATQDAEVKYPGVDEARETLAKIP